ncbi:hypothetical protein [Paenibacillus terreus]|uniref:hypothetical protein n=1 Tax=Paenibacillus terreus TaxID=1387834 RepID=UPI0035CCEEE7
MLYFMKFFQLGGGGSYVLRQSAVLVVCFPVVRKAALSRALRLGYGFLGLGASHDHSLSYYMVSLLS